MNDNNQKWKKILSKNPWDLYIHGSIESIKNENRCEEAYERFKELNGCQCISIYRSDTSKNFCYEVNLENKNISDKKIYWHQLYSWLKKISPKNKKLHIVLDIPSLDLEIILQLYSYYLKSEVAIFALYISPTKYDNDTGLEFQDIRQPRGFFGYSHILNEKNKSTQYIICGFDEGRAQRFITTYDWEYNNLHAILGDPSYIHEGIDRALDANKYWIDRLENKEKQLHKIAANKPREVSRFLKSQFKKQNYLDIVPLGSKIMTLGVLLFYFSLSDEEKTRVRILYDYPITKDKSTSGVADLFLINISK